MFIVATLTTVQLDTYLVQESAEESEQSYYPQPAGSPSRDVANKNGWNPGRFIEDAEG